MFLAVRRAATASLPLRAASSSSCTPASIRVVRSFASESSAQGGLPDSIKRIGSAFSVPNEYPGQDYKFNWSLNGDGVTPLKKSAFRITKPLDLKVAGLAQPRTSPLKVNAAAARALLPEAGSDGLSFEAFDEVSQRTKDLLSLSDHLYCPEGHVPGTRVGVRVVTNSPGIAPDLLAYLERAPRREPTNQAITAYVLVGAEEKFGGYAIEEVEDASGTAKSVAAVVVVGKVLKIEDVVAGIELSVEGLLADEEERKKKAEEEAAEKAE